MVDKIKALFIFEMLGRPPDHIKKSLEEVVDKVGEVKGVTLNSKKIHEPKPVEDKSEHKELFSTFAEIEVEVDNLNLLFAIVLNMLPANVEVLAPEELKFKNFDISSVLSQLTVKIHRYDELAKIMLIQKQNMTNEINDLQNKLKNFESEKKSSNKDKTKK